MKTTRRDLCAFAVLFALGAAVPMTAQAQTPPPTGIATQWDNIPVYGGDHADEYGFRPIFNPPAFDYSEWGMTPVMTFGATHLLGSGEVKLLCNDLPVQFGLNTSLKLNTTVGKAAFPTPQVPIPVSPETRLVCQLWDRKANKLLSEQEAKMLSFQADNKLVSGLVDANGHLHLNGQKGGAFTIKASYDLPVWIFQNLGSYESRFFIRQDK
ncbi:MAG: hypothetical protein JWN14_3135 [Chthonomonadales bacterium]|nr:hypothetical protein [Chthonomonadales bacterium]